MELLFINSLWSGYLGLLLELNAVVDIKSCWYVENTIWIWSCGAILYFVICEEHTLLESFSLYWKKKEKSQTQTGENKKNLKRKLKGI